MKMKIAGLAAMAGAAYAFYFFFPEMRRYIRIKTM